MASAAPMAATTLAANAVELLVAQACRGKQVHRKIAKVAAAMDLRNLTAEQLWPLSKAPRRCQA